MTNQQLELISSKILGDSNDLAEIENLLPAEKDASLLKPLFQLLLNNGSFNFGSPGAVVHYLEKFDNEVYVPELVSALKIKPTEHLIWMLNRYINSVDEEAEEEGINLLKSIAENSTDKYIVEVAKDFLQDYE